MHRLLPRHLFLYAAAIFVGPSTTSAMRDG
jgi:hypothetical protein